MPQAILYQQRLKRVQDAVALKEPDRIPCFPMTGTFPFLYAGYTMAEVMYDLDKAKSAIRKYMFDFEPDLVQSYRSAYCGLGPIMEKLGVKWLEWAGKPGTAIAETSIHQFLEEEYMKEDEYPELLSDFSGWMLQKWLPRSFRALEPLAGLDIGKLLGFGYGPGTMQFASEEVYQALATLHEVGQDYIEWNSKTANLEDEIIEAGFPLQSKTTVFTAFDLLSDTLRGTLGILSDLYENPEQLKAAVDMLCPRIIDNALLQSSKSKGTLVFIPLHKGMDRFMSEEHYRNFYWDTLLKLVNTLVERNLTPYIYTEGPYDSRVECLMDVPKGKTIIHFEEADLVRAKQMLGQTACLSGGVSSQVLVTGTPEQVSDAVKRNLDILAPGGGCIFDISDTISECDPKNVESMFQTVRNYGKY